MLIKALKFVDRGFEVEELLCAIIGTNFFSLGSSVLSTPIFEPISFSSQHGMSTRASSHGRKSLRVNFFGIYHYCVETSVNSSLQCIPVSGSLLCVSSLQQGTACRYTGGGSIKKKSLCHAENIEASSLVYVLKPMT